MASSCIRGGFDWILRKMSFLKEWAGVGTGCPGSWLSHHPGGVQKTCRCGTSEQGLVGLVVLGWWWDLMILEVFSDLWFYDLQRFRSMYVPSFHLSGQCPQYQRCSIPDEQLNIISSKELCLILSEHSHWSYSSFIFSIPKEILLTGQSSNHFHESRTTSPHVSWMMQVQAPWSNIGLASIHKSWSPRPRDLLPLLRVFAVDEQLDIFFSPSTTMK